MTALASQAFDRAPIADVPYDDAAALERKLSAAQRAFKNRDGWLQPHQRIAILRKLAALMEAKRDHLAMQIAREGGKPLPDAIVETTRAIDGVHNAADELRNFAGREIPMGLSAAAENRWAFTTREPIGVVAAISAFNHPLNLIVHQVAPAIAVGCPVIIKPDDFFVDLNGVVPEPAGEKLDDSIDPAVLEALPPELRNKACLCPRCAQVDEQLRGNERTLLERIPELKGVCDVTDHTQKENAYY